MRNLLEPAYILHSRPYRDSSLLIDFFTREHGLVCAVGRSIRGKKSPLKGILQPFVPLLISFYAKRDLATLIDVETQNQAHHLTHKHLFSGFYLNELLMKLLQKNDAHPTLYDYYRETLITLSQSNALEASLRRFEKRLIFELGYGLDLITEANTGQMISPELYYQYYPQKGFILNVNENSPQIALFSGKSLLALAEENFSDISLLPEMKILLRMVLSGLLGKKTLKSRELFNIRRVDSPSTTT